MNPGADTTRDFSGQKIPNTYFDRQFNLRAAKILPGEYYVTTHDMVLVTVLGSCVSACIRDRRTGSGGMNHFMLPDGGVDSRDPLSSTARYGVFAMEMLINELLKLGAARADLEAKVFGGGNVMAGFTQANVGQRNATFVREFLRIERIPLVAEDLLDIHPRKVYFFPATGRVLVRKLRELHNDTIRRRELDYSSELNRTDVSGAVELFV
ncbi:MAG: chemoreceptor glutamine deamidase CheD [Burkholderiaceae bacterium]|jgi:chemotaxis protein CheD